MTDHRTTPTPVGTTPTPVGTTPTPVGTTPTPVGTTPTPVGDAAGPAVAAVADEALHGSYCPKLCTHACPVTSATGREEAVPWGFHRTVSDLASGRLPLVEAVAPRLSACTGCLACRQPCTFDQDVPAQVRAGRAALVDAGVAAPAVAEAVDHVAAGRTPVGRTPPVTPDDAGPIDGEPVTLVAGCRDEAATLTATVEVLAAAGQRVTVTVPEGCCGALLADLGADDAARRSRDRLPGEAGRVVATDPHCLPAWRAAGHDAVDLASHLATLVEDGRLRFRDEPFAITWHDPCVLARGEGVVAAPRAVLDAAGAVRHEATRHGLDTGCSGAGMGMDLLEPELADATARSRAAELATDGATPVVTGCSRAGQRLAATGLDVRDLASVLRDRLVATDPDVTDQDVTDQDVTDQDVTDQDVTDPASDPTSQEPT